MPLEPLDRLIVADEDGRIIRNEELYRELLRAGAVLRPLMIVANDREWKAHEDAHGDITLHGDRFEHNDFTHHADSPPMHLDDKPHFDGVFGDGSRPPGHGDRKGEHLDMTLPHSDYTKHVDDPPKHFDGPEHQDYHQDRAFEGHKDEGRNPPGRHADTSPHADPPPHADTPPRHADSLPGHIDL